MSAPRARLESLYGGKVARITLAAPKANVLDIAMMADLEDLAGRLRRQRDLVAVLLAAEGPHFSFGASIEEHLPERIADALPGLHRLIRCWLELPAPTLAAVRGQCLGGGLELVLACDLVVAEETAVLGCPEIKLGVFPPAASALLPARIGAGRASELVLTGATWSGSQAAQAGLVTRTAPPGQLDAAVEAWLEEDFLPRSPLGLREAARAARRSLHRAVVEDLPALERQYLDDLMAASGAVEGIRAFLEKRQPVWTRSRGAE